MDSWGGVGAYVASSLFVKRRPDLEIQSIENMWLEICHNNSKLLLCISYRPPNFSVDFWGDFQYQIDLAKSGNVNHVAIVFDLNADPSTNHGTHLTRVTTNNNFTIHVTEPTRYAYQSATILDQIITNIPHLVFDITILSPVGSNDHHCVSCKIKTSGKINLGNAYTRYVWDYAKGDFSKFRDELIKTDWNECFQHEDINTTASSWNEIFMRIARKCIPYRLVTIRPKEKPWYHSRLRNLKRKLERLHRKAKLTNVSTDWSIYRVACNNYCRETRRAEEQYDTKLASSLQEKPASIKQWWKLAKHFLGMESDYTYPPVSNGENVYYKPKDKADAFNSFFLHHSDIDTSNAQLPSNSNLPECALTNINVTENDVTDLLKDIDVSKATGPDGISPRLLKEAGSAISKRLSKLFNLSLETKTVPDIWKRANVIPIYKKGEKTKIDNYRPISLLSCVGKLCERVVFKYVFNYFRTNFLLSIYQSGFQPGDSTVNQLIKVYHMLCEALDSKKEVKIVFCDISKAFDRVWHDGLVYKLKRMGIRGSLLSWFIHYLKDRQQRVVIQGSASEWGKIKAGVPQGSVLGPLLFLVYINDITEDVVSNIRLFADDTSLFINIEDPVSSARLINSDLEKINQWSSRWLVSFSAEKTKSMTISNKSMPIQHPPLNFGGEVKSQVDKHKHLGITLSCDLTWQSHIDDIVSKAETRSNIMLRLYYLLDRKTLETMYILFVRPTLEYGDTIWCNLTETQSQQIEQVQKRAGRIVSGATRGTPNDDLLRELGWATMEKRRTLHRLILFHKILNGHSPPYLRDTIPSTVSQRTHYGLCSARELTTFSTRINLYYNSFFPKVVREWNKLDENERAIYDPNEFQLALKRKLPKSNPMFCTGPRKYQILHTRLRLKRSSLKSHLYDNYLSDTRSCECGAPVECEFHYFMECQNYIVQRDKMQRTILNISSFTMKTILYGDDGASLDTNKNIFTAVCEYIQTTGQFDSANQ